MTQLAPAGTRTELGYFVLRLLKVQLRTRSWTSSSEISGDKRLPRNHASNLRIQAQILSSMSNMTIPPIGVPIRAPFVTDPIQSTDLLILTGVSWRKLRRISRLLFLRTPPETGRLRISP